MFNFVSLHCHNCNSVIANLPESEARKLNGLTFQCECCNHLNLLNDLKFVEGLDDNLLNLLSTSSFQHA